MSLAIIFSENVSQNVLFLNEMLVYFELFIHLFQQKSKPIMAAKYIEFVLVS